MSRSHWQHCKGAFLFYGVEYATKGACIKELGLTGYPELEALIRREKLGLPYERLYSRSIVYSAEMAKKRYFASKLEREGFWRDDN